MRSCTKLIFCFFFLLQGCYTKKKIPLEPYQWEEIHGRSEYLCNSWIEPERIYRVKRPKNWQKIPSIPKEKTVDTKEALCEYQIHEGADFLRITVHNFPFHSLEERIPSLSQIERWKKQFDQIFPEKLTVKPASYGGFAGLYFLATGIKNDQKMSVMGWSMQLAKEHYYEFIKHNTPFSRQALSDYTIKVVGPEWLIKKHEKELFNFAESFHISSEEIQNDHLAFYPLHFIPTFFA